MLFFKTSRNKIGATPTFVTNVRTRVILLTCFQDPEKRLSTEDTQLLRNMVCKHNVGLENIAGHIVHQDLAGKLEEEQCKVLCRRRADRFWASRSNGGMKSTPFRAQDVS